MVRVILALVMVGCAGKATPDTPKDEVTDKAPEPQPEPVTPPPAPVAVQTPAELYGECKDRVEGPQKDDECKTDADCATSGCGNEVCTTAAEKGNVMTTCEDKLCFKVLDSCGCHEGECTWTLKAETPIEKPGPAGSLPSSLPPTEPPKDKEEKAPKGEGGSPAP